MKITILFLAFALFSTSLMAKNNNEDDLLFLINNQTSGLKQSISNKNPEIYDTSKVLKICLLLNHETFSPLPAKEAHKYQYRVASENLRRLVPHPELKTKYFNCRNNQGGFTVFDGALVVDKSVANQVISLDGFIKNQWDILFTLSSKHTIDKAAEGQIRTFNNELDIAANFYNPDSQGHLNNINERSKNPNSDIYNYTYFTARNSIKDYYTDLYSNCQGMTNKQLVEQAELRSSVERKLIALSFIDFCIKHIKTNAPQLHQNSFITAGECEAAIAHIRMLYNSVMDNVANNCNVYSQIKLASAQQKEEE